MFRVVLTVAVFLVYARASLPEGSACEDQGVKGTCRKAQSCPSFVLLAKYQDKPQVTECSRDGTEVVICCTDCQIADASKAAVTPNGVLWKTGTRKLYDKCVEYASTLPYRCKDGKKVTPRKVYDAEKQCHRLDVSVEDDAGSLKKRVDFPSLALLGYSYNSTVTNWLCQAFIISEKFLITPAHCSSAHRIGQGELSSVAVGLQSRPDTGDEASQQTTASWQIYKVKRVIQHPESKYPNKYNDIALVETTTEMKFSENVLPLCLSEDPAIPDFVNADVFGVEGKFENEKVRLEVMSEKECSESIPPNRHLKDGINYEQFICYKGFNEHMEACLGSSGRAIYVQGPVPCVGSAVGMTSFGRSCHIDSPTVYTRLHNHLPWIQSVVWP